MISHKHKFIFCHIPKTAGTSVETWFADNKIMGWEETTYDQHPLKQELGTGRFQGSTFKKKPVFRLYDFLQRVDNGFVPPFKYEKEEIDIKSEKWPGPLPKAYAKHAKFKQIKEQFDIEGRNFDEYFKFTVIRNPWDRGVSAWVSRNRKKYPKAPKEPFADFISNTFTLRRNHCDSYLFDDNDKPLYDYAIPFETLQEGFDHVCNILDIKGSRLPHKNRHKRERYQTYYDNVTRDIIQQTYKKEVEHFNYTFDDL